MSHVKEQCAGKANKVVMLFGKSRPCDFISTIDHPSNAFTLLPTKNVIMKNVIRSQIRHAPGWRVHARLETLSFSKNSKGVYHFAW